MNLPDFLAQDRHGFIHLAEHRIGLRHIVELYNDASTPEMIQAQFPSLPLTLIQRVIAFYLENRGDIDEYVQQGHAAVQRQAVGPQPGPSAVELRQRMEARRAKESA